MNSSVETRVNVDYDFKKDGKNISRSFFSSNAFSLNVSSMDLHSTYMDFDYEILVGVPSNYNETTSRYPTVYLLDASYLYDGTYLHPNANVGPGGIVQVIEELVANDYLPPCILVGISPEPYSDSQRFRDFVSKRNLFYDFLRYELTPLIDGNYTTDPTDRTILGHSLGGIFTTYCLYQCDPANASNHGLFNRFIALSSPYEYPGYDYGSLDAETAVYESYGNISDPSFNVSVFLAIGELDNSNFVSSNVDLANRLNNRSYSNFRFQAKFYEEYNHSSVVRPGFTDGLKWVFSKTAVDFEVNCTSIRQGEWVQFTFTGNEGKIPFNYEWDFGDNSTKSSEANPVHQFTHLGDFCTKLTVTDGDGHRASKQTIITVLKQNIGTNGSSSTTSSRQDTPSWELPVMLVGITVYLLFRRRKELW
jgi:enterochelin esterase-like enzyme